MTIYMLAAGANLFFGVLPSGQTYTSDLNSLIYINNNSTADQTALLAFGCVTLAPVSIQTPLLIAQTANAATLLALPSCAYVNGTLGVGATLTASANGALTAQDGVTLTLNQFLLVKNQVDMTQNGFYKLTTLGDSTHKFVLTRATGADQPAELAYGVISIAGGTLLTGAAYLLPLDASVITIGSTILPFCRAN
jgi:hypothetical protein